MIKSFYVKSAELQAHEEKVAELTTQITGMKEAYKQLHPTSKIAKEYRARIADLQEQEKELRKSTPAHNLSTKLAYAFIVEEFSRNMVAAQERVKTIMKRLNDSENISSDLSWAMSDLITSDVRAHSLQSIIDQMLGLTKAHASDPKGNPLNFKVLYLHLKDHEIRLSEALMNNIRSSYSTSISSNAVDMYSNYAFKELLSLIGRWPERLDALFQSGEDVVLEDIPDGCYLKGYFKDKTTGWEYEWVTL